MTDKLSRDEAIVAAAVWARSSITWEASKEAARRAIHSNRPASAEIRSALAGEEPSRGYAYVTALERERDELKADFDGFKQSENVEIKALKEERDALARKLKEEEEGCGHRFSTQVELWKNMIDCAVRERDQAKRWAQAAIDWALSDRASSGSPPTLAKIREAAGE